MTTKTVTKSKKSVTKATLQTSVRNANRRVARANAAFQKLTPAEKRVQIARDVLAQLESKRLHAARGIWVENTNGIDLIPRKDIENNTELRDILSKVKKCEGCALGGMFMCALDRVNSLKVGELQDVTNGSRYASVSELDTFRYLKRFFTLNQLKLIEYTYEQGEGAVNHSMVAPYIKAYQFGKLISSNEDRMRLIMENIIVNNGVFKPEKLPVQKWVTPELSK